jgi:phage baseplate assembly protein W
MAKIYYKGFSTDKWITSKGQTFGTSGIDTVKRDFINHIFTIVGERHRMPTFGTRIPLMVFEIINDTTKSIIEEDIKKVVNYDPRIELIDLQLVAVPNNNLIVAWIDLKYLELGSQEVLKLDIPVGGQVK